MKKLLVFIFVCFGLTSSAQVFIKTAAFLFPATSSLASVSFGLEIKHKHVGYEYLFNTYSAGGDGPSFSRSTFQIAVKYYFISSDSSRFKFYTAALLHYKSMKASDELPVTADGRNVLTAKGIGYGFLLGNNLDVSRHIGFDSGISIFYLSTDNNYQFRSFPFNQLCSKFHIGVKLLLYIRL